MSSSLFTYLKTLYPKHSDELIEYYASLIENHDEEKLPATEEMSDYIKIDKQIKKLEKEKDQLRLIILNQKQTLGHNFQQVNIKHVTGKNFDPSKFYDWVSSMVDEKTLEEITIKTIDEKKLIKLEAKGIVEYDKIPEECYTDTEQWRISVGKSKGATLDDGIGE